MKVTEHFDNLMNEVHEIEQDHMNDPETFTLVNDIEIAIRAARKVFERIENDKQ